MFLENPQFFSENDSKWNASYQICRDRQFVAKSKASLTGDRVEERERERERDISLFLWLMLEM